MISDPQPFRIDDLLRDLSSAVSGGFGEPPIGLRFDVDPALPRHLVGDVLQLRQLLGELCGDAIRFADKGTVLLSLAMIQRSASAVTVEFALRGTGVGAAVPSLTASQGQVALLGGELKTESVPGEGSRLHFCLTLPVVRGPADDGAAPMPIGAAGVAGSPPAPPDPARRHAVAPPTGVGDAAFAAGVDISAAMTRFGDNVALYRRTLSMFVKELPARPAQLAALVAACETEPALRWLHTLKGQAATIGAGELSVAAADAETRLAADATASGIAVAARMAGAALADAGPRLEALLQALQAAETPGADLPPARR